MGTSCVSLLSLQAECRVKEDLQKRMKADNTTIQELTKALMSAQQSVVDWQERAKVLIYNERASVADCIYEPHGPLIMQLSFAEVILLGFSGCPFLRNEKVK